MLRCALRVRSATPNPAGPARTASGATCVGSPTWQSSEGFAQLSVRDHGPGVPSEARDHIFGRFSRAVSSRWYGGLGLGLYVSSQIVEAHGGRLSLTNVPGNGACFVAQLPALAAQSARWVGANPPAVPS